MAREMTSKGGGGGGGGGRKKEDVMREAREGR